MNDQSQCLHCNAVYILISDSNFFTLPEYVPCVSAQETIIQKLRPVRDPSVWWRPTIQCHTRTQMANIISYMGNINNNNDNIKTLFGQAWAIWTNVISTEMCALCSLFLYTTMAQKITFQHVSVFGNVFLICFEKKSRTNDVPCVVIWECIWSPGLAVVVGIVSVVVKSIEHFHKWHWKLKEICGELSFLINNVQTKSVLQKILVVKRGYDERQR